jgi:hypothetical protein
MKTHLLFCCGITACVGTDTGNPPVIDFRNSACHDQSYTENKDAILQSLDEAPLIPDPKYKGLTCFAFEQDANAIHLLVSNYKSGCESQLGWTPRLEERSDGGLDLILEDRDCATAACGWCLYDLSFDLPLELASDREVHLVQRGCEGAHPELSAQLALTQQSGVACAYTDANALAWRARGGTSERMLCGETATCDIGLTCTTVDTDPRGRCLKTCTTDANCDALSLCTASVCQLKATGLTTTP